MKNLFEIHDRVGFYLGFTSRTMINALSKRFLENGYDITAGQWPLLMMLWEKDGLSQNEITKCSFKEKTTITRLITSLEKKNIILRVRDKNDRRNNFIYLTNKGKELKDKLIPIADALEQDSIRNISEDEIKQLKDILYKIYNNIAE